MILPADLVVVRGDVELYRARGINLPGGERDVPGDIQRAVSANIPTRGDEIGFADRLERKIANVDEPRGNRQAARSERRREGKGVPSKAERRHALARGERG